MTYLEIVGWSKFQHYKHRRPRWIKLHNSLLENDDYLDLPPGARSLLVELWLWTSIRGKWCPKDPAKARERLGRTRDKHLHRNLELLQTKGFIRDSASEMLEQSQSQSQSRVERESDNPEVVGDPATPTAGNGETRAEFIERRIRAWKRQLPDRPSEWRRYAENEWNLRGRA